MLRRKPKVKHGASNQEDSGPEVDHLGGTGPVFHSIELATAD